MIINLGLVSQVKPKFLESGFPNNNKNNNIKILTQVLIVFTF